jgi:hypothetical protein
MFTNDYYFEKQLFKRKQTTSEINGLRLQQSYGKCMTAN